MKHPLYYLDRRRALNAYVEEDYRQARTLFEKVRHRYPNEPGILYNLGLCALGLKKYSEAESFFLADLERYGESPSRLRSLADLYFLARDREKALDFYRRLEGLRGDELAGSWLEKRITLLEDETRSTEAMEAAGLMERALEAAAEKESKRAIQLLEQAAEQDPSSFQIRNNLGVLYMKQEKRESVELALKLFRQADDLMPLPLHKEHIQKALGYLKRSA